MMLHLHLLSLLGFIVLAFSPYCDSLSSCFHLIMIHRVPLSELVMSHDQEARDACAIVTFSLCSMFL